MNRFREGGDKRGTARLGLLAIAGLAGTAVFVLAIVSLHFLRPDYDPAIRTMSEFAIGPFGYLMTLAFFTIGLGSLALAIGLRRSVAPSRSLRAGSLFLGVWAVGIFLDGIFPGDLGGTFVTTTGAIHTAAAFVGVISLMAAAFLLSRAFKADPRWQPFHAPSRILAYALLVGFVANFATFSLGQGVGNRISVAVVLIWPLVTAGRLLRAAKTGLRQGWTPRPIAQP